MALHTAELVHQVFRHQQEIRNTLQPPGQLIRIKLIDGVKRLAALLAFANSKYKLGESSYSRLPRFQYFNDMSLFLRNRFMRAQIPCYIINPCTPKEIIDDIKKRIRTSF
jgi:erythromycin esterase-like protein